MLAAYLKDAELILFSITFCDINTGADIFRPCDILAGQFHRRGRPDLQAGHPE